MPDRSRTGASAGRPFIHPLSLIRAEHGWTYQDVVDVVARRVGNMSARREKAWRWEHRGVIPDRETQIALADELGVPHALLRSLGWPGWLPVGELDGLPVAWTPQGCVAVLDATAGFASRDRRGFHLSAGGAIAAVARRWQSLGDSQTADPPPAAVSGGGTVTGLEQRLPSLRLLEMSLGGGRIRAVSDAELRLVTDLLLRATDHDGSVPRLFAVAAELGRLAGRAAWETGHQAAAERYFLAGLSAAHAAADRALGGHLLSGLGLQLLYGGRIQEAAVVIAAARDGAGPVPARVTALLTLRQARAEAALGLADACDAHLGTAAAAMARAPHEPSPCWADAFDEAEYAGQVAACHLALGRPAAADPWLGRALAAMGPDRDAGRARCLLLRAQAAIGLADHERAATLLREAGATVARLDSPRTRRDLEALRQCLSDARRTAGAGPSRPSGMFRPAPPATAPAPAPDGIEDPDAHRGRNQTVSHACEGDRTPVGVAP